MKDRKTVEVLLKSLLISHVGGLPRPARASVRGVASGAALGTNGGNRRRNSPAFVADLRAPPPLELLFPIHPASISYDTNLVFTFFIEV